MGVITAILTISMLLFKIFSCVNIIMKNNNALNNFNNVMEYILLLPIDEQIYELDKIMKYHENYHHPHANVRQKYAIINQIKDLKKDLIIYHLQELRDIQI